MIAREVTSLFRLQNVETIHAALRPDIVSPPADARSAIADILAVVPRERETAGRDRGVPAPGAAASQRRAADRDPVAHGDEAARRAAPRRMCAPRCCARSALPRSARPRLSDAAVLPRLSACAWCAGSRPPTATVRPPPPPSICCAGWCSRPASSAPSTSPVASLVQQLGGAVAERLATTAADAFYAVLPHGAARHHRHGHVPADPVPRGRGAEHHLDGDERDPAAERADAAGLTRHGRRQGPQTDMVY